MPTGNGTPRAITESYFAAENRRDLADILEHFAEDARFVAPDGQVLVGRDKIHAFYAANTTALPKLHVELIDEISTDGRGALEWRAEGHTPGDDVVCMRGTNVVTVADGRFTEFRAYWCTAT